MAVLVTFTVCVLRMFSVRHPYFEPKMFVCRHLLPILLLITFVEMFLAAEHVLEEVFLEEVMRYGTMTGVQLDWPVLSGILSGCMFTYWWLHIRRFSYLKLIIIGLAGIICYLAGMYFLLSSDIHLSLLYLPMACRGFAYAVLSATFMICLEEIMSFQHFFQALSVFNILHMVMGGVIGAAIYTRGLAYCIPDNIARYGTDVDSVAVSRMGVNMVSYVETLMPYVTEISIKQIYGWTAYACVFLFLLFLLYDAPIRRDLKRIPAWRRIRKEIANGAVLRKISKR